MLTPYDKNVSGAGAGSSATARNVPSIGANSTAAMTRHATNTVAMVRQNDPVGIDATTPRRDGTCSNGNGRSMRDRPPSVPNRPRERSTFGHAVDGAPGPGPTISTTTDSTEAGVRRRTVVTVA